MVILYSTGSNDTTHLKYVVSWCYLFQKIINRLMIWITILPSGKVLGLNIPQLKRSNTHFRPLYIWSPKCSLSDFIISFGKNETTHKFVLHKISKNFLAVNTAKHEFHHQRMNSIILFLIEMVSNKILKNTFFQGSKELTNVLEQGGGHL